MATYSSILAWRSPWIKELGELQSTGSQRIGHNWRLSMHAWFGISPEVSWKLFSPGELFKKRKKERKKEKIHGIHRVYFCTVGRAISH